MPQTSRTLWPQPSPLDHAGGKLALFRRAYDRSTYSAELRGAARTCWEMQAALIGKRPSGSGAAPLWDDELRARLAPTLLAVVAKAGVAPGDITKLLAEDIADLGSLELICEAIVELTMTVNGSGQPLQRHPIAPLPETAASPAAEASEVQPAAPPQPARRRGRRVSKSHYLPATIFQALNKIGVSDVEVAIAVGVPRSTWNRVSNGTAEEMGLSPAQAQAFAGFVGGLKATLDSTISEMARYGLKIAD
ncbi:hypothetical protein JDN40_03970 [Rhodomicrobium vannielii ATCC 17100]|uniref:hypothetical protein n=1 Tax=Rhodomicrobium vannielii TaxID=1069 RepID=UPI001919EE45|nr:hypothetical protein [Rhodomicrobium vannielii]MBJ7533263.1 hypothetical protein [Rhodomicrobium vannielii ATCC 17100]